ncbi:hypothetical protein NC651_003849 [Populus alba x Populus x berolinensis]|nr:hypothetical protein NC651_003849 [Populus alba x Populus x berolinensis]
MFNRLHMQVVEPLGWNKPAQNYISMCNFKDCFGPNRDRILRCRGRWFDLQGVFESRKQKTSEPHERVYQISKGYSRDRGCLICGSKR